MKVAESCRNVWITCEILASVNELGLSFLPFVHHPLMSSELCASIVCSVLVCPYCPVQVVVPLSQSVDAAAIGRLLWEACDGGCEGKVPIGEDVKGTPLSETVTTVL